MGILAVRAGLYSWGAGTGYCSETEGWTQTPHPAEWDNPDRDIDRKQTSFQYHLNVWTIALNHKQLCKYEASANVKI